MPWSARFAEFSARPSITAGPDSAVIGAAALLAGGMMIAVGVAAVLRAVGVRLPQVPLPGLIQRLVLTGQRAAFALTPLPRALCVGLLTAFLPCGWLYLFASYAAGTGSPLWGALFMIAFWLGSVPALLLAGVGVQTLARLLGRRLPLVTALTIVVFGVVTLVLRVQTPIAGLRGRADPSGCRVGQAGRGTWQDRAAVLSEAGRGIAVEELSAEQENGKVYNRALVVPPLGRSSLASFGESIVAVRG